MTSRGHRRDVPRSAGKAEPRVTNPLQRRPRALQLRMIRRQLKRLRRMHRGGISTLLRTEVSQGTFRSRRVLYAAWKKCIFLVLGVTCAVVMAAKDSYGDTCWEACVKARGKFGRCGRDCSFERHLPKSAPAEMQGQTTTSIRLRIKKDGKAPAKPEKDIGSAPGRD